MLNSWIFFIPLAFFNRDITLYNHPITFNSLTPRPLYYQTTGAYRTYHRDDSNTQLADCVCIHSFLIYNKLFKDKILISLITRCLNHMTIPLNLMRRILIVK